MKKLVSLLLALIMVLSLAACGAKAPATDAPATEAPTAEETDAAKGCGSAVGFGVCLAAILPAAALCIGKKRKRD